METPLISVLLPTFDRNDILPETLSRIADQTIGGKAIEVIVIDDADSDETERLVSAFESSFLSLHYLAQKNEGQSKARNRGVSVAHAELVFFLGDDILLRPDVLEQHLAFHRRAIYDNVAVFGKIEMDPRLAADPFISWLHRSGLRDDFSVLAEEGYVSPVRIEAAHLSIPRKHAARVPFDETLRYYENFMWARALFRTGFLFYYLPQAVSYHFHPITLERYGERMYEMGRTEARLARQGVAYFVRAVRSAPRGRRTKVRVYNFLARITGKERYRNKYWRHYLRDKYYRGIISEQGPKP